MMSHTLKLYAAYTRNYEKVVTDFFVPSLGNQFETHIQLLEGATGGEYRSDNFAAVLEEKQNMILNAITENWGGVFVVSDVDIQIFKPITEELLEAIEDYDIVCLNDPAPKGPDVLCAGFFICRANDLTRSLWELVKKHTRKENREQACFNYIIQHSHRLLGKQIRYNYLPKSYINGCSSSNGLWKDGMGFDVPDDIALHHANWTIGIEDKIAQLTHVRDAILAKQ